MGEPPGGGGYNRCLVSMVSSSELSIKSVELEQCVSSCWHKKQLSSRVFADFHKCFRNFAAFSTIDEYFREQLMG